MKFTVAQSRNSNAHAARKAAKILSTKLHVRPLPMLQLQVRLEMASHCVNIQMWKKLMMTMVRTLIGWMMRPFFRGKKQCQKQTSGLFSKLGLLHPRSLPALHRLPAKLHIEPDQRKQKRLHLQNPKDHHPRLHLQSPKVHNPRSNHRKHQQSARLHLRIRCNQRGHRQRPPNKGVMMTLTLRFHLQKARQNTRPLPKPLAQQKLKTHAIPHHQGKTRRQKHLQRNVGKV